MANAMQGIIAIWSGAVVDIPFGWKLCDGSSGTPDLRDRFIVGAGGGYPVGTTGGANSHKHNFGTTGHQHSLPAGSGIQSGSGISSSTSTVTDSGQTETAFNRPPYYALCFIMHI